MIGVKEDRPEKYKDLHTNLWPYVNKMIKACDIQNDSIDLTEIPDGTFYLFSYFEYVGDDFEADMAKMAAVLTTQKWWKTMEEVYHLD